MLILQNVGFFIELSGMAYYDLLNKASSVLSYQMFAWWREVDAESNPSPQGAGHFAASSFFADFSPKNIKL